jgi:hypothetical protein
MNYDELSGLIKQAQIDESGEDYSSRRATTTLTVALLHELAHINLMHLDVIKSRNDLEKAGIEHHADILTWSIFLRMYGHDVRHNASRSDMPSTAEIAINENEYRRIYYETWQSGLANVFTPLVWGYWILLSLMPDVTSVHYARPIVRWCSIAGTQYGDMRSWIVVADRTAALLTAALLRMEDRDVSELTTKSNLTVSQRELFDVRLLDAVQLSLDEYNSLRHPKKSE